MKNRWGLIIRYDDGVVIKHKPTKPTRRHALDSARWLNLRWARKRGARVEVYHESEVQSA